MCLRMASSRFTVDDVTSRPSRVAAPLLLPVDLERIAPGRLADPLCPVGPRLHHVRFTTAAMSPSFPFAVVMEIHTRSVYTALTTRGARTMHRRVNITLPEETIRLIDRVAAKGDRSHFIAQAVRP